MEIGEKSDSDLGSNVNLLQNLMLIMADRLATTVARSSVLCQAHQRNFDSISPCLKLNDDACLNLDVIIGSFSAPITEEHAWAIVFEAVKCLENLVKNPNFSSNINTPRYVIL